MPRASGSQFRCERRSCRPCPSGTRQRQSVSTSTAIRSRIPSCATRRMCLSARVEAFFDREVKPHVPDAWINEAIVDKKDGKVGRVGYEINFNRYFYKYEPPRPLAK